MKQHYCVVRQSILDKGQSVPVGKDYYGEPDSLEYRWTLDDEVFQVLHEGMWQNAESSDFDFLDDETESPQERQQREDDDYENDCFNEQQFG